jgi:DedD protein
MALSSLFKRKAQGESDMPTVAATAADGVQKIRTRTRQRLIGAVVLVTLGVIGFPLLFESQPRPIPVDIPIEVPAQDKSLALVLPAAKPEAASAQVVPAVASDETVLEVAAAKQPPTEATSASRSAEVASVTATAKPAASSPAASAERTAAPVTRPASESASQSAAEPRFVVQVGAFADPASARDIRLKLEKLGLKTYAQTVDTDAGKRTRVRLGPFASRAEADKAAARVREAGVTPAVLKL